MPYDETPQEVRRKFVPFSAAVRRDKDVQYNLYFVQQFPLELLRNKPLEDIKTEKFRQGRLLLLEDIRERGMLNPLIVWNHANDIQSCFKTYPLPWYLKLGLNRRWCLGELGYAHAPAFVTMNKGHVPPFAHEGPIVQTKDILRHWKDGVFVWHQQGPTGKGKSALDKYEFPAFGETDAIKV